MPWEMSGDARLQPPSSSDAFDAVFGARQGVVRRTRAEEEHADARDDVANDVDAFLTDHAHHARAIQFRHHVELPGEPGSLVCCHCDTGVHAPMSDTVSAVERSERPT